MNLLTVSQLNRYIAFQFKEDTKLKGILIKGEISNFTHHMKSGHFYFTVKDSESSIKAVMFRSFASVLKFMPENGMHVIVNASVSVYERDGVYQLYVTDMQPDGAGQLFIAFEQLKAKLADAGMFDEMHKRKPPVYPKKIGVITSAEGAVFHDIVNVVGRRYPVCEIVLYPALVQGENAPEAISKAIIKAGSSGGCDVLIVARGGGSFEDLNAFNAEKVAYAIYNSTVPVISAVGHETDYTIADFVADLRAPTPSAAAELAVPPLEQIKANLGFYEKSMRSALTNMLDIKYNRLVTLSSRIRSNSAGYKLKIVNEKLNSLDKRLRLSVGKRYESCERELSEMLGKLDVLNPLSILSRGFSVVYKENRIVTSSEQLNQGDEIDIKLGNGQITAKVMKVD